MLREIYGIGKVIMDSGELTVEGQFMDKPKLKNTKKVLCVTFGVNDGRDIRYIGIYPEEYDEHKADRYLYKRGTSKGTDILPSTLISKGEVKTFENKFLKWFENNHDKSDFLGKLYDVLVKEVDNIEEELKNAYSTINKDEKRNVLLTLKIIENGKSKYLKDFPIFREILLNSSKEKYYYLSSMGTSKGVGTCYLCGKEKEVYGFVLPAFGFSFSTADKPGFVVDFRKDEIWKEVPICEDCAITLEVGKKYLDENLSYAFYGNKYYVIPQIIVPEKSNEILSEIMKLIKTHKNESYQKGLVSEEDEMAEIAIEEGNIIKLTFIFYKAKQSRMLVLNYVENVLPTYLGKIYKIENKVREKYSEKLVKNIFGKNSEGNFVEYRKSILKKEKSGMDNWYIAFGRKFFTSDKEFLEYVENILSDKSMDRRYLISKFMDVIRSEFRNKNDSEFKMRVVESMMIYDFLKGMGLIRGDLMGEEKEVKMKISEEKIEEFFEERENAFGNNEAKAAFLVGALVNYVLQVQRTERNLKSGDEPFRAKLYALNLDEKKVKKIFKEAVEKLGEYKKGSKIESVAADYLTRAGNGWKLSREDISYYFSLGMVLGSAIFLENKENNENRGEENGIE